MANEGKRRFRRAWDSRLGQKVDKPKLVPAMAGAYFNGQKTLNVSGRPDFIWARIRGKTSEVVQVFNDVLTSFWDLPILVYRDPNYPDIWKVYGRDISRYEDWGGVNYIPKHGAQHSFASGADGSPIGADVVWVFKRQFVPMLLRPLATATMAVYGEADFYYFDGGYSWFPGTGTSTLEPYKPTGAHNARYATVYLDPPTNNLLVLSGPEFDVVWPPDNPGDYIAVPSPDVGIPLGAVLLMTGTDQIGWGEIYDLRNIVSALGNTGSFSDVDIVWPYDNIGVWSWDDGVPLCTGTIIDWGVNLSATCSGTVLLVDAVGGSGTIELLNDSAFLGPVGELDFVGIGVDATRAALDGTIYIHGQSWWDDGTPLCTGTVIDWGDNLGVSCSGTVIRVNAQAGGAGGIMNWDEGVPLCTGTIIDWGGYLDVSCSGTVLRVDVDLGDGLGTGTWFRAGEADPLETITGGYWKIPEGEFATGSLCLAVNGIWQTPVTDFSEQWPASGTFVFTGPIATGTVVAAQWGAPYAIEGSGGGGGGGGGGSGSFAATLMESWLNTTPTTYTADTTWENIRGCSGTVVFDRDCDVRVDLTMLWAPANGSWEYHHYKLLYDGANQGTYMFQKSSGANTNTRRTENPHWVFSVTAGSHGFVVQTYDGGSGLDRNILRTQLTFTAPRGGTAWVAIL